MVNAVLTIDAAAAERALVLRYVPADRRSAIAALWSLDETLARIVRTTREPIVGQMRLTWWYEALCALDTVPPPAEPVLAAVAVQVIPRGVSGRSLAVMIDAWEALLGPEPVDERTLALHADARGAALFAAMGRVLATEDLAALRTAGAGWALADVSLHLSDPVVAATARRMATGQLSAAFARRWPVALRPIGMMALLARADLTDGSGPGSPARLARLLMHRIWGR